MTTIAAYVDKDGTRGMIADSAVTGNVQHMMKRSKLFEVGALVVGTSGMLPPIMANKKYPATETGVRRFVADFKKTVMDAGHGESSDGLLLAPMEAIIIGKGLGPYKMGPYFELFEPLEEYCAIGSGGELALGVLHMCRENDVDAEKALASAAQAASAHDPGTGDPAWLTLLALDPPKAPRKKRTTRNRSANRATT